MAAAATVKKLLWYRFNDLSSHSLFFETQNENHKHCLADYCKSIPSSYLLCVFNASTRRAH